MVFVETCELVRFCLSCVYGRACFHIVCVSLGCSLGMFCELACLGLGLAYCVVFFD